MLIKLSSLLFLSLAFPLLSAGSDYNHDNIVGEWNQYSRNESGEFGYFYMKIEADFSGIFSYQLYQAKPTLVTFSQEDLSFEDGFVVLDDGEFRRVVFSAYGGILLTGVMWFYQQNGTYQEPFNSFFLRLSGLSAENSQADVIFVRKTVNGLTQ